MERILHNLKETESLAKELASKLKPGHVVALYGDLGSGKTTLVQNTARELGIEQPVTSPTFVIQKNYELGNLQLIHIDCYRLNSIDEARDLGFEELFSDKKSLVFVEWAEKIEELLPKNTTRIRLMTVSENERKVEIDD